MPSLAQIRQNAFVPYGTAGFASANNAAALPGPDLPPSGYPNFNYGGQTYGQGGNVSINNPDAIPGAGYNPNTGWTGRLPRYAAGGLPGLAVGGAVELYKRLFGNKGNPSPEQMGGRPPSNGNLSDRPAAMPVMNTRLSGPAYDYASHMDNLKLMAQQAYGGAPNSTGNTQDPGHNIFGSQSRTHGLMSDGVVEIQPGGIYDTVFAHGMGANNPNAYHSATAASLYQNPPESAGQAAPPLTTPTGPQPIGSGQAGPFVGPLQMPGPLPIGNGQQFQGPIQYPRRQPPYNQPPGFYGGPIRGKYVWKPKPLKHVTTEAIMS